MIIPLEWMPPLMFSGLVVFMLIGYPVAFSLAAVGFFFGFLSIEFGYFTLDRKSTRLNSSHVSESRMPSSA